MSLALWRAVGSMKILFVSLNFAPELTGIGKYSGELVDGLIARGHEVTVVCAPPYYPAWRVHAGHKASAYRTERPVAGLTIRRCPIWIPKRLGGLARLVHMASFALSSLPVMLAQLRWRPNVVFVVAPALACAPGAWLTARLAGAKTWLHIQDFEVDAAFELGLLKHPLLRRMALAAERQLLRRFDVVSTISGRMLAQLAAKGVTLQRSELLPNWVDLTSIHPGVGSEELRRSLGIGPSQTVCLFSGTMNRKQGLGVLIAAARLLQHDPNLVMVVCGQGEMRSQLESAAAGLTNVRFLGLQPASQLNALLNLADIHLLPQLRGAADLVMPSKLGGMLASARPVVAAAEAGSEVASIAVDCGIVVEPESAAAFAQAIVDLAGDSARRQRLGAAGRSYAERVLAADTIFDRLHHRLLALHAPRVPACLPAPDATPGVRAAQRSK
jgi:colanic acid biosynthesis glycosyl transferase WcaI